MSSILVTINSVNQKRSPWYKKLKKYYVKTQLWFTSIWMETVSITPQLWNLSLWWNKVILYFWSNLECWQTKKLWMISRNCSRRGRKRRRKRKKRKEARKRRSDLLVSLDKILWESISSNLEPFRSQFYSTIHRTFCLLSTLPLRSIVAPKLLSTTPS